MRHYYIMWLVKMSRYLFIGTKSLLRDECIKSSPTETSAAIASTNLKKIEKNKNVSPGKKRN